MNIIQSGKDFVITGFDHVAVTATDLDAFCDNYARVLDARVEEEHEIGQLASDLAQPALDHSILANACDNSSRPFKRGQWRGSRLQTGLMRPTVSRRIKTNPAIG